MITTLLVNSFQNLLSSPHLAFVNGSCHWHPGDYMLPCQLASTPFIPGLNSRFFFLQVRFNELEILLLFSTWAQASQQFFVRPASGAGLLIP